jgi:hypothetical protein
MTLRRRLYATESKVVDAVDSPEDIAVNSRASMIMKSGKRKGIGKEPLARFEARERTWRR